jgi:ribonucleotide reductase alpha subunit
MHVLKRGNRGYEAIKFDKITTRISNLCKGLNSAVDPILVAQRTVSNLVDGISTEEIDNISANVAEYLNTYHHHYGKLSARIRISNLHKTTPGTFSECMLKLQLESSKRLVVQTKCFAPGYDPKHNLLFKEDAINFISEHKDIIDPMIINDYDYKFDCVGIKTLMHNYLHKKDGKPYDRPQYMFMRVAIALYKHLYNKSPTECFNAIKKCYKRLASLSIMHATPTLFNACTHTQQLLSCFLLGVKDDISQIMNSQHNASIISKYAGGIGVHLHQIRCNGSYIHGTSGESSGLIPQAKMWNDLACAWNQGGKRKGSIALYLEPSHGDIMRFLELKLPVGDDESRARDLFYALWITDLFMERYLDSLDNTWSLFSNNEAKNLSLVYDGMPVDMYVKIAGDSDLHEYTGKFVNPDGTLNAYTKLYLQYEAAGLAVAKIRMEEIDRRILRAQRETGTPYICYKDHANRKTNHQNIGTIQSFNLCVHGDTYILTDRGQYKIGELSGENVNVWNGNEFSRVKIMQTGVDQELIRVALSNGAYLDCTLYHKFYIVESGEDSSEPKEIRACDLKPGDKLIEYNLPVLKDGPKLKSSNKFDVPFCAHRADKIAWLNTYTCGFITSKKSLVIDGHNYEYLSHIRLMLQSIGVNSSILPLKYKLLIDTDGLERLLASGYTPKNSTIIEHKDKYDVGQSIFVQSIRPVERADTFCFTEPKRHMGMFNGILTGQCGEIAQYSDPDSYACCTLMSIVLSRYVVKSELGKKDSNGLYNFDPLKVLDYARMHKMVRQCVRNLNSVIDFNDYPVHQCAKNNFQLRPMGIGIQGLADLFCKLRIPFISPAARIIDNAIMETIYHAYITESAALAQKYDSYEMFEGSPVSRGILQFDMWKNNRQRMFPCEFKELFSGLYDWDAAKFAAMKGMRNSLGVAPMPTVSTSQISGNNECFEPYHSNVYLKSTLGGRFIMVNTYLLKHLSELGLWSKEMRDEVLANDGSIQDIDIIPQQVRDIYKTVWEIPQRELIMRSAQRSAFIDQSMSMNIYLRDNSDKTLRSVMRLTWSLGLKTGSYYIRTKPATSARKVASSTQRAKLLTQNTTADPEIQSDNKTVGDEIADACPIGCTSCSG